MALWSRRRQTSQPALISCGPQWSSFCSVLRIPALTNPRKPNRKTITSHQRHSVFQSSYNCSGRSGRNKAGWPFEVKWGPQRFSTNRLCKDVDWRRLSLLENGAVSGSPVPTPKRSGATSYAHHPSRTHRHRCRPQTAAGGRHRLGGPATMSASSTSSSTPAPTSSPASTSPGRMPSAGLATITTSAWVCTRCRPSTSRNTPRWWRTRSMPTCKAYIDAAVCSVPNGSSSMPDFISLPTYRSACRPALIACAAPPTTPHPDPFCCCWRTSTRSRRTPRFITLPTRSRNGAGSTKSSTSPALQLSFTANHAHLVPEGVAGFLDAMPLPRVREVRLADCFRNGHEQHLNPGQGDFDFPALVQGAGEQRLHRPLHERVRLAGRHAAGARAVCRNGDGLTHSPRPGTRGNKMPRLLELLLAAVVTGALPVAAMADVVLSSNDGHTVMDAQKTQVAPNPVGRRHDHRHRRQVLPAQDQGDVRGTRQRRRPARRDLDQQGRKLGHRHLRHQGGCRRRRPAGSGPTTASRCST